MDAELGSPFEEKSNVDGIFEQSAQEKTLLSNREYRALVQKLLSPCDCIEIQNNKNREEHEEIEKY